MGARKNWSEEQIIGILKQVEAGRTVVEVCRENGVGESTFYKWRSKYGGLEMSEMRRLKALEEENAT
jgi:putative transposase